MDKLYIFDKYLSSIVNKFGWVRRFYEWQLRILLNRMECHIAINGKTEILSEIGPIPEYFGVKLFIHVSV